MSSILSFTSDPVWKSFMVHSSVLAVKVLVMAPLTARYRYKKKVFANPEDIALGGGKGTLKYDDPDVERVRRAHLNDLENIPVFWVLGALYLTTDPSPNLAVWLFRTFTVGRILHTIVMAVRPVRQPARAIAYQVSNTVTWFMGIKVIMHYFSAL
uniref:Microsomal glutathione S-transferase 1 n=1 Tax=Pectinophora gossypiella TaxID=13191 RepID=A0A1E1WS69_PECGO